MAKPLNVLQLITDRDRRGAQVFALDLAAGLQSLGAAVETVALAPGTHGDLLPVRALGARRLGFRTLKELRRVAADYDVVVAHGSSTLPASVLALVGMRLPIVYRQISDPEFWAASWSRRLRGAALLRRTKAIVALSEGISAVLKRHYWLGGRPKITVIPNAVPEDWFRPPRPEERVQARKHLRVPDNSEIVLVIGALAPEKGADLAISACAELQAAALLIVGDGPQRSELEALASRHIPDRCFFVGSLDNPRVAYWSADLLLFPSRGGDSMPAVLIEAGLCGLPSVTTDVGATSEVIDHDVTGLVVGTAAPRTMAAAVSEVLSDHGRRLAMGRAASARCSQRFTIASTAPAWLGVLSDLSRDRP